MYLIAAGAVSILVTNVWYLARRIATNSTEPRLTAFVKVAWALSLGAVIFPIIVPFAIIFAIIAYLQARKTYEDAINRTGIVLAFVNSSWAIISTILMLYGLVLANY